MDVDKDDIDVDNGIPAVINVEAGESEDSSGASTTLPAADGGELRRIATEMKNLSQQLEVQRKKKMRLNASLLFRSLSGRNAFCVTGTNSKLS